MRAKLFALSLAGVIAGMGSAHTATDINFWHSMQGALGERVHGLVDAFNKSQSEYVINDIDKGKYGDSMHAGIEDICHGNIPDRLQEYADGKMEKKQFKDEVGT